MDKKLPSVFASPIANNINNNRKIFYSKDIVEELPIINDKLTQMQVRKKISEIFAHSKFIYKIKLLITTKEYGNIKEIVIANTNDGLLTIDNKKINYDSIIDVKII